MSPVASLRGWPKSHGPGGRNHVDCPAEIRGIRTYVFHGFRPLIPRQIGHPFRRVVSREEASQDNPLPCPVFNNGERRGGEREVVDAPTPSPRGPRQDPARRSERGRRPGYGCSKWPRSCRFDGWNAAVASLGPDRCNRNIAHVQPTGACHYHGLPEGLINRLGEGVDGAADGVPFYLCYAYQDRNDPRSGLVALRGSWMLRPGTRAGGPGGLYGDTFREDWEYVECLGDLYRLQRPVRRNAAIPRQRVPLLHYCRLSLDPSVRVWYVGWFV